MRPHVDLYRQRSRPLDRPGPGTTLEGPLPLLAGHDPQLRVLHDDTKPSG